MAPRVEVREIALRRTNVEVTEPPAHMLDRGGRSASRDAAFQQGDGGAVAQRMGRDLPGFPRKHRVGTVLLALDA